jgi:GNAT superfamily N-acetyltransferase
MMPAARYDIVTIARRHDLVPLVGQWLWDAFWRDDGHTLAETLDVVAVSLDPSGPQQTFVLLADGVPVGTASLAISDLDERPDLTPWLAGVFVVPEARGQGHAGRLIAAVEQASRAAGIATLWLHTSTAERVYQRAGWQVAEASQQVELPDVLMRRDLDALG